MDELLRIAPGLALAIVVGYFLGALPLADRVSARLGIDIFSVGTGLAGASNVRRSVGRWPALFVLVGDLAKGATSVVTAEALGVEGPWVILPVAGAVVGHWKSIFSRFRGGDGLLTLGGSAIAMFPVFGIVALAVAVLVALGGQRMPYSSLLSVAFGYASLVGLSLYHDEQTTLALGFGGVSALVLAYALNGHRRRRHTQEWEIEPESGREAGQARP